MDYYITPEDYEKAELNGIHASLLKSRVLKYGWSKERAISESPNHNRRDLKEWTKIAEKNGIAYGTLLGRLKRGWSLEDATTKPLVTHGTYMAKARESRRVFKKETVELAERNGISYNTFRSRIRRGWGEYDAATTPLMTKQDITAMLKARWKY